MILPILTQDCETLHLTHSNFKKLEGCQYKFLRTMCNKKWEDFVHYTELFDLLNYKQISLPLIAPSAYLEAPRYSSPYKESGRFTPQKSPPEARRIFPTDDREKYLHIQNIWSGGMYFGQGV